MTQLGKQTAQAPRFLAEILILLGIIAYYAIKFFTPRLVLALHQAEQFPLLNFLSGGLGAEVAEFYIGEWEERVAGPASSLLSGVVFLAVAWRYFVGASKVRFGIAVFLFFVLTKFETLFNPPFGGDAITAVFAEAIWLHRNHLDFVGLFHQPSYVMGGPRTYLVSVYPAFLAITMSLLPSAKTFLLFNHLLMFVMGSVIVTLFREIAAKIVSPQSALLGAVALLSFPMIQSQVEMINMEMPCLFFTFLSAYALVKMKWGRAVTMAVMAGLVKGSGVIAHSAVLFVCLMVFFFHPQQRGQRRILFAGLVAIAIALAQVWFTNMVHNQKTVIGFIKLFVATVLKDQISWAFLFCLAASGLYLVRWTRQPLSSRRGGLPAFLQDHYPAVVMVMFAVAWYALFMNFTVLLARYKLLAYPFLIFWGLCSLKVLVRDEAWLQRILVSFTCLWLLANFGWLELERGNFNYIQIGRSLEYRNVLKRDVRLARDIEEHFSRFLIAAQPVVAHFLAQPELGYVHKNLEVMIYSMTCTYSGIKNFPGLKYVDVSRTIWIGYDDPLSDDLEGKIDYPVDPQDVVLKEIVYGRRRATIFVGGYAVEKVRKVTSLLGEKRRRHFGIPETDMQP